MVIYRKEYNEIQTGQAPALIASVEEEVDARIAIIIALMECAKPESVLVVVVRGSLGGGIT